MKKVLVPVCVLLIAGCASKPELKPVVMPDFPKPPTELMQPAPELETLADDKNALSDLLDNVNTNYSKFYLLKDRYLEWQEWYNSQEKIWDGLKRQ